MGSSSKKKAAKRADFQKSKLKVGKARPKPNNFTDTSFKSKAIALTTQNLAVSAPSSNDQFGHHLSMLSSHSAPQRRDSLSHITNLISSLPHQADLPQPPSILLPKLSPMILDGSASVRAQVVKLLRVISRQNGDNGDIAPQVDKTLLYVRAGLTHIAPGVRETAGETLGWLLDVAGSEVVSCAGGWAKTLKALCVTLNWRVEGERGGWKGTAAAEGQKSSTAWTQPSVTTVSSTSNLSPAQLPSLLNLLADFLRTGLLPILSPTSESHSSSHRPFPLDLMAPHLLPRKSNAYANLNLFGAPRDTEGESYEDVGDRRRVFRELGYEEAVGNGLESLRKEGGEVGRAAGKVRKVLDSSIREAVDEHEGDVI